MPIALGELDLEEAIEEAQGETFKVFYCNDAVRVASEELDDL